MAWSNPPTAAAGDTFTASMWNTGVRDNLNMMAAAVATAAGRLIVTSAPNTVAQRQVVQDIVDDGEDTSSTSYTNLATTGPDVTVTTGVRALIFLNSAVANDASNNSYASYEITGATTSAAIDGRAIVMDGASGKDDRIGVSNLAASITPGSNTFRMRYRVSAATGTYTKRSIMVMAL